MPAKNVLWRDAQIVAVLLNVAVAINPTITSLSRVAAENVRLPFARSVRVGTSVRIVGHGPISESPTKSARIGLWIA